MKGHWPNAASEHFDKIVQSRQTNKFFDGKPVDREILKQLLDWAILAPNHRMNEPWRFRCLDQPRVQNFIKNFREKCSPEQTKLFESALNRLSKAGAMIYVSVLKDEDPLLEIENYAAACAAVEHILLGAACYELGSFWSSNKAMRHSLSREVLGLTEEESFVAAIWLGYVEKAIERPTRKKQAETIIWPQ